MRGCELGSEMHQAITVQKMLMKWKMSRWLAPEMARELQAKLILKQWRLMMQRKTQAEQRLVIQRKTRRYNGNGWD